MSPVNLFCTVPLLGLSTQLSKYLLYNVSLDAAVEEWARRRNTTDDDDDDDDNDDDDDPKTNCLGSCSHNMHAISAAVNKNQITFTWCCLCYW